MTQGKKQLMDIAFKNAQNDPRHKGQAEPLIVLDRNLGDTLTWLMLDGNNPQPGFIVSVHPFSTLAIVPAALHPISPVPALFDGFPQTSDSHGLVHSGLPTEAAVKHPFGWHKFTVTLGDAVLDPCIFV